MIGVSVFKTFRRFFQKMAALSPVELSEYFESCLNEPSVCKAVSSTLDERSSLGKVLLEISLDWKRILSPMLTYEVCQEALILVFRQSTSQE
jgi:hypothetical protein